MARICPDCFDDHSKEVECTLKSLKQTVKMFVTENEELKQKVVELTSALQGAVNIMSELLDEGK